MAGTDRPLDIMKCILLVLVIIMQIDVVGWLGFASQARIYYVHTACSVIRFTYAVLHIQYVRIRALIIFMILLSY